MKLWNSKGDKKIPKCHRKTFKVDGHALPKVA
jgi:hypothetical protein